VSDVRAVRKSSEQHATSGHSIGGFGHRTSVFKRSGPCRQQMALHSFCAELLRGFSGAEQLSYSRVLVVGNTQWMEAGDSQHPPGGPVHAYIDMQQNHFLHRFYAIHLLATIFAAFWDSRHDLLLRQ